MICDIKVIASSKGIQFWQIVCCKLSPLMPSFIFVLLYLACDCILERFPYGRGPPHRYHKKLRSCSKHGTIQFKWQWQNEIKTLGLDTVFRRELSKQWFLKSLHIWITGVKRERPWQQCNWKLLDVYGVCDTCGCQSSKYLNTKNIHLVKWRNSKS